MKGVAVTLLALVLAGCQSTPSSRYSVDELRARQQAACPHSTARAEAVARRECLNRVMIAYRQETRYPGMDLVTQAAHELRLAAIEYRDGRISEEEYRTRFDAAHVRWDREAARRMLEIQAQLASMPPPPPPPTFEPYRTTSSSVASRPPTETRCTREFNDVVCRTR